MAGRAIEGFGSGDQPPPASKRSPRWLSPRWLAQNGLGACAKRAAAPTGGHGQLGESLSAALHELAQHCASGSPSAADAASLVCRAAAKVFKVRADGALVDDWGCCQIMRAALAVHECALRRGGPASRRAVYQGHPEVFRLEQLAQPRAVAVSGCAGAAAAVSYCGFLDRASALCRFYPALDVAAGTRLYGEREREGGEESASFSYSARAEAIREALGDEGGAGRPRLAKEVAERLRALQAATAEAMTFAAEASRLEALERRTCPLRPVGEHTLARRSQIAICSDALQLLQHEWDCCERLVALTVDWPGPQSAGGADEFNPLQLPSRQRVEELVAATRAHQDEMCRWGEALRLGRGGDALSMARVRAIRERGSQEADPSPSDGMAPTWAQGGFPVLQLSGSNASIPSSVEAQPPSEAGCVVQASLCGASAEPLPAGPGDTPVVEAPIAPAAPVAAGGFLENFDDAPPPPGGVSVDTPLPPQSSFPGDLFGSGDTLAAEPGAATGGEPWLEARGSVGMQTFEGVHPSGLNGEFLGGAPSLLAGAGSVPPHGEPPASIGVAAAPGVLSWPPQEALPPPAPLALGGKAAPSFTMAGQFSDLNPFSQI